MLNLIPLPYRVMALAGVLVLTNAVSFYRGYHTGYGFAEARWTAEVAKVQDAATKREKALAGGVQRAAEDAYNEQVETEKRLADADGAVDRLRETVRIANGRANSAATAVADGQLARTLLAECAGSYRDVAKQADRLRAIVIGLQAYAREVSQ